MMAILQQLSLTAKIVDRADWCLRERSANNRREQSITNAHFLYQASSTDEITPAFIDGSTLLLALLINQQWTPDRIYRICFCGARRFIGWNRQRKIDGFHALVIILFLWYATQLLWRDPSDRKPCGVFKHSRNSIDDCEPRQRYCRQAEI